MHLSEFDYALPGELIAQEPLERRDASRLMVLEGQRTMHRRFSELPSLLNDGDVLVLNDSRVIPARLRGRRETGGRVELLVLGPHDGGTEALVRGKAPGQGETIRLPEGSCRVVRRLAGARYLLAFEITGGLTGYLERFGEMPTPPYIKKRLEAPTRYQTVYADPPGSVAAPTAGLHFTPAMLEALKARGVDIAYITLHVGPATFQPIRADEVERHRMEPEYFKIGSQAASAINGRRGRLVAVGTTTVKALESAMAMGMGSGQRAGTNEGDRVQGTGYRVQALFPRAGLAITRTCASHSYPVPDTLYPIPPLRPAPSTPHPAPCRLAPAEGQSELFIYPGYDFRMRPDALLTNFHLPRSTLIMLVSALVGRERLLAAYAEAVRQRYRFYSFGDAMLCSN